VRVTEPLDAQARAVVAEAALHLQRIGSANDAEDHGYRQDAQRMRRDACAALQALLVGHPFLGALVPRLRQELDSGHILGFGWSVLLDDIERHL